MKIKNLTIKPLGFGSTVILPDEVGTLPRGYGKNHPTVKYYLSRKWIKEIGGTVETGGTPAVNVGVNLNTGGGENLNNGGTGNPNSNLNPDGNADNGASGENPDGATTGSGADNGAGGNSNPVKSLDRMNKEELQALAFQRGIQYVEADTRQVLIDKIKAAQNGNE